MYKTQLYILIFCSFSPANVTVLTNLCTQTTEQLFISLF